MTEIRNLTRNGETFYPLTCTDAIVNRNGDYGIDDEPTIYSDNLVKSSGIYNKIFDLNNKIVGIESGDKLLVGTFVRKRVRTAGDVIDSPTDYGSISYDISNFYGILKISTPLVNQYIRTWAILDSSSNVLGYGEVSNVKNWDYILTSSYTGANTLLVCCQDNQKELVTTFIRSTQLQKRGNMSVNTKWVLENNNINTFKSLSFSGVIDSFSYIALGHGKDNLYGSYITVTGSTLTVHNYVTEDISQSIPHGLTIKDNIQIYIEREINASAKIRIVSDGESFEQSVDWRGEHSDIWVQSFSSLRNCTFGWSCSKYKSDIFLFGDSYFDPVLDRRWLYYLIQDGYTDVLIDAFPGRNSAQAYPSFLKSLTHGNPKYVVWCMGMNDPDSSSAINSSWKNYFDSVREVCKNRGIEMIATTCPSCSNAAGTTISLINTFKNEYVRNSGLRYIDFSHAVVKNETTGVWFDEMPLSPGEIHPSVKGAKSLYHQAISDFPELLMQK